MTLEIHAGKYYEEALGYMKSLEKSLTKESRFSSELRYQISAMTIEKFFVALLAHYGANATHHTPMALINEVQEYQKVPDSIRETAKLIGKFESICSLDGFGYKIPDEDELLKIVQGLVEIKAFVGNIINSNLN